MDLENGSTDLERAIIKSRMDFIMGLNITRILSKLNMEDREELLAYIRAERRTNYDKGWDSATNEIISRLKEFRNG